jgi:hypothetical protein
VTLDPGDADPLAKNQIVHQLQSPNNPCLTLTQSKGGVRVNTAGGERQGPSGPARWRS